MLNTLEQLWGFLSGVSWWVYLLLVIAMFVYLFLTEYTDDNNQ